MAPWLITLLIILGVCLLLGLIYLLVLIRPRARKPSNEALLCDYAHRGLHGGEIPENSLAAFEKACEAGFGIELDVQLSRDGTVMVFHDYTLARMTGREGKLKELDAAELQSLSLNGTTETIPTFAEVLALVDGRVPLLVELKGENLDTSLCEKVASHLSAYKGTYCLESFNPLLIGYVKRKRPEYKRGQLVTILKKKDANQPFPVRFMLSHMLLNFISRPHFIAFDMMKKPTVGILAASSVLGAKKFAWTVRSAEDYNSLKERGILSIFENFTPSDDA